LRENGIHQKTEDKTDVDDFARDMDDIKKAMDDYKIQEATYNKKIIDRAKTEDKEILNPEEEEKPEKPAEIVIREDITLKDVKEEDSGYSYSVEVTDKEDRVSTVETSDKELIGALKRLETNSGDFKIGDTEKIIEQAKKNNLLVIEEFMADLKEDANKALSIAQQALELQMSDIQKGNDVGKKLNSLIATVGLAEST